MIPTTIMTRTAPASNGSRRIASSGATLPLVHAAVDADASGGIARVVVRQHFQNVHDLPLSVTYSLPLPADAAVSGFEFRVAERRIVGEVDKRDIARDRFEQALVEGKSAALLEQDRCALFTQNIGNIPPHTDVHVEVTLDQRLRWLDEGAWELRIPTTVAPRFLGASGRIADADRVQQDVADGPLGARLSLRCVVRDLVSRKDGPYSVSHRIVSEVSDDAAIVRFAEEAAPLDRDVVVRWKAAAQQVGARLRGVRPATLKALSGRSFGLLTLVPPAGDAKASIVPRDLVVLIDTSGSMQGEPLAQAKRVVAALIHTLTERDTLAMLQFSWTTRRWNKKAVRADERAKRDAHVWLDKLEASGGTEMRDGILQALEGLRADAQRQVVLVTDGLIGFEQEVVAAILHGLPRGSRVHTVGVGSAVNRSLTSAAARAGHGVEVIVGLGEDAEPVARTLCARTCAPVVVELQLEGDALVRHAPRALPDLFQGAPALVALELRPEGGSLLVRGRTAEGSWEQRLAVPGREHLREGDVAAKLFAREEQEDLEAQIAAGERREPIDEALQRLGVAFQIATRLTSWFAVSEEPTVDPSEPVRKVRMPHELPHGLSAEGLGLRPAIAAPSRAALAPMLSAASAQGFGMPVGLKARMPAPLAALTIPRAPEPAAPPEGPSPARGRRTEDGQDAPVPSEEDRAAQEQDLRAMGVRQTSAMKVKALASRVVHRVGDLFAGPPDQASKAFEQGEPAAPSPAVRTLIGTIVRWTGDQVVVEVQAPGESIDWQPPPKASLRWSDDSESSAVLGKGTRAGSVPAGACFRLVLVLSTLGLTQTMLDTVTLETPSGTLVIRVRPR